MTRLRLPGRRAQGAVDALLAEWENACLAAAELRWLGVTPPRR